ncbi:DDE superfamily endonuclease [Pyrenophora tritici-repentis]|nr:DDE superfamily endonuclease [Pyrenophora tritici-repentis]KAI1684878.1 DDE superfamily endonuclease [Pyrenophora tritici-repentis]
MKAKYGILDEDTYNFDETGFQISLGGSVKVVTASQQRLKPISRQAGDKEWITLIAAINAMGWLIPPFFIFRAKNHQQAWYHGNPKDWRVAVSDKGWTNNEIGVAWLRHFIDHTTARTVGGYRLLIIDGHESHQSVLFQDICKENNIITLCMPPHTSHILQPLDVGCFGPLKRAYKKEVGALANYDVNHIDKKAFLAAFLAVYKGVFSSNNIRSGFRATGLVPINSEVVISRLEIKPRTPSPPLPTTTWQPRTPSNAFEIDAHSTLISDRIRQHHSSSPASIIEMVQQFNKGAKMMVHSYALMADEMGRLRAANAAATERKQRMSRHARTASPASFSGPEAWTTR